MSRNLMDEIYKLQGEIADLKSQIRVDTQIHAQLAEAIQALELIAASKRSDGTYNRSREACEQLANETLNRLAKS